MHEYDRDLNSLIKTYNQQQLNLTSDSNMQHFKFEPISNAGMNHAKLRFK